MFAVLVALLIGGGVVIAMYWSSSFSVGGWYASVMLIVFACVGRAFAQREFRGRAAQQVYQAMRVLLLLLLLAIPAAASDVTTKYETVKVADGIYAFIAPEPKSGPVNSNWVAIIGDDGAA